MGTSTSIPRLSRLLGAAALLASGAIHLDLYLTSYHSIPTIGPLLGADGLLVPSRPPAPRERERAPPPLRLGLRRLDHRWRPAAVVGVGLFGFKEVPTTAGLTAGVLETVAIATLGYLVYPSFAGGTRTEPLACSGVDHLSARLTGAIGRIALPLVVLAALALSLLAGIGGPPPRRRRPVRERRQERGRVARYRSRSRTSPSCRRS